MRDSLDQYPDGFFSYADAQGAHEQDDPATFLHLIYAASLPQKFRDNARSRRAFLEKLFS